MGRINQFFVVSTGGWLTGRVMLSVYEAVLVCALAFEIFCCYLSLNTISELRSAFDLVSKSEVGTDIAYTTYEGDLSRRINKIFYGASSQCANSIRFRFLWKIIGNRCDTSLVSDALCARCNDNSIVACFANRDECESGNKDACFYDMCRRGILDFLVQWIK